jgi:hypothetical protein
VFFERTFSGMPGLWLILSEIAESNVGQHQPSCALLG